MQTLLSTNPADNLAALNQSCPGAPWRIEGGALAKSFTFPDFKAAFAFMTRVAAKAEALNHHPDWTNIYNRVDIRLSTHDAGGLTQLDFALAQMIEEAHRA